MSIARLLRLGLILAVSSVALAVLAFCVYGWSQGFHVGRGLKNIATWPPGAVADNPPLVDVGWQRVTWLADLNNRDLNESSGLTASAVHPGILWSINDSGSAPELFALGLDGSHHARMTVHTDQALDWEAMDSVVLDGVAYLLIGDIGDNFGWRDSASVLVVREPATLVDGAALEVAWQVDFRYPEGPRDAEALAADGVNERILVLSKREYPPLLFSVPLQPGQARVMAAPVGALDALPQPTDLDYDEVPDGARYRHMPSGMDLAGTRLLITTYQHAYLYNVADLSAAPLRIRLPTAGQREAITFAAGQTSRAYFTRERFRRVGVADLYQVEFGPAGSETRMR